MRTADPRWRDWAGLVAYSTAVSVIAAVVLAAGILLVLLATGQGVT